MDRDPAYGREPRTKIISAKVVMMALCGLVPYR